MATGGCFDLLHGGHVATLEAARALGSCLVVCVNSGASTRRLKGPDRPLVPPEALLASFRPDVWVKGGDHDAAELPEAGLVETWGGRTVILPLLPGRAASGQIEAVARG